MLHARDVFRRPVPSVVRHALDRCERRPGTLRQGSRKRAGSGGRSPHSRAVTRRPSLEDGSVVRAERRIAPRLLGWSRGVLRLCPFGLAVFGRASCLRGLRRGGWRRSPSSTSGLPSPTLGILFTERLAHFFGISSRGSGGGSAGGMRGRWRRGCFRADAGRQRRLIGCARLFRLRRGGRGANRRGLHRRGRRGRALRRHRWRSGAFQWGRGGRWIGGASLQGLHGDRRELRIRAAR